MTTCATMRRRSNKQAAVTEAACSPIGTADLGHFYQGSKRKKARPDYGQAFHRKELERRIIGIAFGTLGVEQFGTGLV